MYVKFSPEMLQYDQIKLDTENDLDGESMIVPRALTSHDDPDDDHVKLEIETMMALHGIRMEDEVSDEALQSLINIPESICKEEKSKDDSEQTVSNLPEHIFIRLYTLFSLQYKTAV